MNKIIATYVSDYDSGRRDGTGRVLCPFCGDAARERDIEQYTEEGTERSLEMCTNCREGFERDLGLKFKSDVLPPAMFSRLWDELPSEPEEPTGLNAETAEQVAKALGGEAWQSGGGIWLVIIRRKNERLVVLSEDVVCEYASESEFDEGRPLKFIALNRGSLCSRH